MLLPSCSCRSSAVASNASSLKRSTMTKAMTILPMNNLPMIALVVLSTLVTLGKSWRKLKRQLLPPFPTDPFTFLGSKIVNSSCSVASKVTLDRILYKIIKKMWKVRTSLVSCSFTYFILKFACHSWVYNPLQEKRTFKDKIRSCCSTHFLGTYIRPSWVWYCLFLNENKLPHVSRCWRGRWMFNNYVPAKYGYVLPILFFLRKKNLINISTQPNISLF